MQSFERIRDIVHGVTGVPNELITAESTPAQLNMDSLDLTEIILEIEEEFDILVDNEDSIHSMKDLMEYVDSQVA